MGCEVLANIGWGTGPTPADSCSQAHWYAEDCLARRHGLVPETGTLASSAWQSKQHAPISSIYSERHYPALG